MARHGKQHYTLIEFGTDKICVLYGTQDENGAPKILSFAQKSSGGCISKGMIIDYNNCLKILKQTLNDADKNRRMLDGDKGDIFFSINGYPTFTTQGSGTVLMGDAGKKITAEHIDRAVDQARNIPEPADRVRIGVYDSYFVIDSTSTCRDPRGQLAERLDAFMHLVYTERKRVDRINAMLRELGFEQGGEAVPAGIMPVYSALTEDERNQGAILIDMGAGITTYAVIAMDGVLLSGAIPAGRDNIANDLAVGLEIPYDYAQTFIRESRLRKMRDEGSNYLEYTSSPTTKKRRIPLDSFEKIIMLRMREIFSLIRDQVEAKQLLHHVGTGCVLTGGGAMIDASCNVLQDVMGLHTRIGEPSGVSGANGMFPYAPCCYAGLIGMMKYAINLGADDGTPGKFGDTIADMFDDVVNKIRRTRGAIKI